MMEFWVNGKDGMPFFFITSPVNEKMLEMLEKEIIPQLLKLHTLTEEQREKMKEIRIIHCSLWHLTAKVTVRYFSNDCGTNTG
ncbi:MAG: hypothetical protein LBD76_00110 [Prevotellaceae bacterium]|jgi:hypothetical protein|nr:hypothetical protein [Prevotellaceae bacterium]